MTGLSRRAFVATAASVPALLGAAPAPAVGATGAALLLYDPQVEAGRRFAARAATLGTRAVPLVGDRVALLRPLLGGVPALWGVSRHADALLVADIAHEQGFRVALTVHQRGQDCARGGAAADWPERFAMQAAGRTARCGGVQGVPAPDFAVRWVLRRASDRG